MKGTPRLLLVVAMMGSFSAIAQTTYYVRTDGGDSTQCTGLADAAYPGSGTAQPCAFKHPFWALDASGQWVLHGGDTLVIRAGSYKMGYGEGNLPTDLCSSDYTWACHLPPLPSGPDAAHPTRVLGEGWDSGCASPPQLWGAERADWILDLTGTSNAVVGCLEITDRSGCADWHCDPAVACQRDQFPYGNYADVGIRASDSSNVTLKDLNVHGMAWGGIHAGRISDWTIQNVRVAGNGGVGWDGDLGEESSDSGTIRFSHFTVEWNGCPETYPGLQPSSCWGQQTCGGYGDGVGLARSGGHFIIEDSVFRHNVSDGLDLLYVGVDHPDSLVEVYRSQAYGNAGNQMKIGGTSRVVNCLISSDCAYFYQKPIGQYLGNLNSGDHCRAGGAALSVNLPRGKDAYVVNSTLAGQGWACAELQCNTLDFPDQPACDGTERVYLQNSIFQGYQVVYLDYERLADFIGDGDPYHFTTAQTADHNLIHDCEVSSPTGPNTLTDDPLFVNGGIGNLDAHLQSASPAIGQGLPIGSLGGLVPADDVEGLVRTDPPDLGAYEYQGSTGCTLSCTASAPASAQVDTPVSFTATATPSSACTGNVTYHWDFGDGPSGNGASATHTYTTAGTFSWTMTAKVQGVECIRSGSITVTPAVTPPYLAAVTKASSPFRLKISGSNLQAGLQVFIGNDPSPWPSVAYKNSTLIVLKSGSALKARFPQGQAVQILVVNPDGGQAAISYTRP